MNNLIALRSNAKVLKGLSSLDKKIEGDVDQTDFHHDTDIKNNVKKVGLLASKKLL